MVAPNPIEYLATVMEDVVSLDGTRRMKPSDGYKPLA